MSRAPWKTLLLVALPLLGLGFGPAVVSEKDAGGLRLGPEDLEALVTWWNPPSVSAASYLLVDYDSGQVLVEHQAREQRAVASTTKIMTALLVLEQGNLGDRFTVSAAAAYTGGNTVGLLPGEEVSVRELLGGLLLSSGNDAATALAEYVGGSTAGFAELMNARAQALGMPDTHFMNPHGLDVDRHHSSAYDLWTVTREALQYPVFREMVSSQQKVLGRRTYLNLNQLLGSYDGADGVKTGTTDWAGQCLVASATRNGHRLVLVVLNSLDRYVDATRLLNYGFGSYQWVGAPTHGRALNRFVLGAEACRLKVDTPASLLVPAWQGTMLRSFRSVRPPSEEVHGGAEHRLYLGDTPLLTVPMALRCESG